MDWRSHNINADG